MTGRPNRITALSIFFAAGTLISLISAISLMFPESFLKPIWRLNPRAYDAFHHIGSWGIILLLTVSTFCGLAAYGLWFGKIWGYRLAIGLLIINLIGDIYNFASGKEPRAIIGIPIVALILAFILRPKIKVFFEHN